MNLINKKFQGKEIIFDYSQNGVVYLNATKTAKQFGKEAHRWLALKETKEYISALEEDLSDPAQNGNSGKIELLKVVKGNFRNQEQGTWLHPKLTIFFARWLDIKFSIWCDRTIEEILKKGFAVLPEAKKSPSKDLIDVASQIMQTRKATVEKRHQLLSMIEKFLDSQTEYKPNSLSTVISNVYQYLHIATSLKTAVLVIEDNLINSKNGLKINSYNPKQERAYDRDYLVAVNYYSEKQLAIFDRYFQSILEDVVMHLESPHTKATSKSVINILKNSGQRQIKLVTELEIGASFQGKSRNEIDTLVDNYRSGKIDYFQMVEELQTLKMGKSFKV